MLILQYDSIVFDCDGVILQSNAIKSTAFAKTLEGEDSALVEQFVDWHKQTGGVSRFEKLTVFYRDYVQRENWQECADAAVKLFGDIVTSELIACPYIPGFEQCIKQLHTQTIPTAVNTGGLESEVKQVFKERKIDKYFSAIYGSPNTKHDNMLKLKKDGFFTGKGLYIGDAKLDFDLAKEFGLDFIFVAFESEWKDGATITQNDGGTVVQDLQL